MSCHIEVIIVFCHHCTRFFFWQLIRLVRNEYDVKKIFITISQIKLSFCINFVSALKNIYDKLSLFIDHFCLLVQKILQLSTVWGPWLSILANHAERPQLQFISLWLAHRFTNDNYQHNKNGQENEYTTNCHCYHCTITH